MAASENQMTGALCLLNGSEKTVWMDAANPAHLGFYRGMNKIITAVFVSLQLCVPHVEKQLYRAL